MAYNPSTRECYWATAGGGAYHDGAPIRVSTRDGVQTPVTVEGLESNRPPDELAGNVLEVSFAPQLRISELAGVPTVFAGCKVAEGAWDGFLYEYDCAHDLAALRILLAEAGGKLTDRHGNDQRYDQPLNGGVGSNGIIHRHLIQHWPRR